MGGDYDVSHHNSPRTLFCCHNTPCPPRSQGGGGKYLEDISSNIIEHVLCTTTTTGLYFIFNSLVVMIDARTGAVGEGSREVPGSLVLASIMLQCCPVNVVSTDYWLPGTHRTEFRKTTQNTNTPNTTRVHQIFAWYIAIVSSGWWGRVQSSHISRYLWEKKCLTADKLICDTRALSRIYTIYHSPISHLRWERLSGCAVNIKNKQEANRKLFLISSILDDFQNTFNSVLTGWWFSIPSIWSDILALID